MASEAAITRDAINKIKAAGYWVKKIHGSRFSSGWPDILVLCKGLAVFIEMKQRGELPTKVQIAEARKIINLGGAIYLVANSGQEALRLVEEAYAGLWKIN